MIGRPPDRGEPTTARRGDPNLLISLVASLATAFVVLQAEEAWRRTHQRPAAFLAFLALTILLQLVAVEVYNRGSISFASAGLLSVGFTFGAGAAMICAALMGLVNLVARKGRLNRGVFDAAQFALSAGAGAGAFALFHAGGWSPLLRIGPALAAGAVYTAVNIGLLCLAMSLAENRSALDIWRERFAWTTPYSLASGPLAAALTLAYDHVGITGLVAFTLPPVMMMFSVRQYVSRTRRSVEEVRAANEELSRANRELAERNQDLQELFQFAGGLAARAHARNELLGYAETALTRLVGAAAKVSVGLTAADGDALIAGGKRVGAVTLERGFAFDEERWRRLREAILPQLATAIESSELVEEVRKKHLATIAALSRSMEAKDYYTGGHTERVAAVAVALASRLGYEGADLDAVEIGALLHDIGKIGIPERILHKPGPLDEDEWKVMKEHPIISEYILSEVDLPATVLHIARSSHERMDGKGYPDGLAGEQIPLEARIVLVADAWDALTSDRPYRRGRSTSEALHEMRANAGTQFCPDVIQALERLYREEPHLLGGAHLRAVVGAA